MDKEYGIAKAFGKLNDLKSYTNVLTIFLTGYSQNLGLAQDWFNENIGELELCVKEYFGGDSDVIHEIEMLKGYINHDVCNLEGVHEMRAETAKILITNKIVEIEELIKNRIAE